MTNKVDILINMVKQGHGDEQAVSGLKKLSSGFESLTGVSLTAVGAFGLATKAIQFLSDAVNETVDYAMTVKDFSMALGVTTEEASKLIQIGDDLRVSQETMASGFRYALDHGVIPSVDGLARMSEEMMAMEDPTQRMSYAIDQFGRAAGGEMMRVLEQGPDAIRAMSDELEGSALIMSEDAVQAADDYRLALDEVQDSFQGVKYTIGNEVIPVLTDLFSRMNEGANTKHQLAIAEDQYNAALQAGLITEEQSVEIKRRLNDMNLTTIDTNKIAAYQTELYTVALDELRAGAEKLYPEEERFVTMMQNGAFATEEVTTAIEEATEVTPALATAIGEVAGAFDEGKASADLFREGLGLISDSMVEQQRVAMVLEIALMRQNLAVDDLTEAEQEELAASIEAKLGALDNLSAMEQLNAAKKAGTIDEYQWIAAMADGIVTQEEVNALLGIEAVELGIVSTAVDTLGGKARDVAGTYDLEFNVSVTGDAIPSFPTGPNNGGGGIAMASGGSFVVPPGFPNDSFVMGLTSGEQVSVLPNNYYNLTINEAGSRGNIITDFALLKSLAGV